MVARAGFSDEGSVGDPDEEAWATPAAGVPADPTELAPSAEPDDVKAAVLDVPQGGADDPAFSVVVVTSSAALSTAEVVVDPGLVVVVARLVEVEAGMDEDEVVEPMLSVVNVLASAVVDVEEAGAQGAVDPGTVEVVVDGPNAVVDVLGVGTAAAGWPGAAVSASENTAHPNTPIPQMASQLVNRRVSIPTESTS